MRSATSSTNAWIVWFLGALFMFYKFALEVSPSIMTETLMRTFQINATQLGNFAACYFYAYLLLQMPAGILLDRFGSRIVATIAIALCALGNLLFANSTSFFLACLGRFLIGAGAAFATINAFKLTANWFPLKRFAFLSGLVVTVAMIGAVGGQAPLAAFIQEMGWRPALEILGIGGLVLALLFALIVRDSPPGFRQERNLESHKVPMLRGLKKVLSNPQSWWISIYSGFAFTPVMVFGGLWGVSFIAEAYSLEHAVAAQSVSLIFIGFAIGTPFFGWLSDRLERRKIVLFWGTILALLSLSIVIYLPGTSQSFLMVLLLIFGFGIGAYVLSFSMIREISATLLAATAMGFLNAFNALFGAFSDPLTGYFLDLGFDGTTVDGVRHFSISDYRLALSILPLYLLFSLLTLLKVKETRCKHAISTPPP